MKVILYTREDGGLSIVMPSEGARLAFFITLQDGTKVKRWSPIWRDTLCRWCWDWRRRTDTTPPIEKLAAHHNGQRVMVAS